MWRIVAGLLASLAATVAAAAAVGTAAAEPCHDGDVVAARDADLQVLAGARCLRGPLTLTRDVARLAPLATLAWIEGDLRVVRTDRLRSLRGLDALARVGGDVQIGGPKQGTPGLRDVDGLRALVEIGGDLYLGSGWIFEPGRSRTSLLRGVSGLTALRRVGGDVTLFDLAAFRGLPALVEIGGDLVVRRGRFATLGGLDRLARIGGSLRLDGNRALWRIDGLRALVEIGGDVDAGCLNRNPRLAEATVRRFLTRAAVRGRVWFVAANTPHRPDAHPCE